MEEQKAYKPCPKCKGRGEIEVFGNQRKTEPFPISDKNNWDGLSTKCPFSKEIQKKIAEAMVKYVDEEYKKGKE